MSYKLLWTHSYPRISNDNKIDKLSCEIGIRIGIGSAADLAMASDAVFQNNNINNNNDNHLMVQPQVYYPSADASAHRMRSSSCVQASLIREFCDKPGSSSTPSSSSSSSSFFQPTLAASQAHPSLHSPSQSSDLSTDPPPTFSEQVSHLPHRTKPKLLQNNPTVTDLHPLSREILWCQVAPFDGLRWSKWGCLFVLFARFSHLPTSIH